ncbi:J domain-containing protein [Sneathiella glossodoripedis]|uniref:J domain-containing protein n=1 Tax=Sneathiella glossodoripedis TaxID=418853 RepID=UPI00046FE846|nr:DnaJ domain-containing protein [Sneathiella glossodoripedis]
MRKGRLSDIEDGQSGTHRGCAHESCEEVGEYKAPKSRMLDRGSPDDYQWFCLKHIREFNKKWNFFDGMSDDEVLKYKDEDITGHRPTWQLGARTGRPKADFRYDDPFEFQKDGEFGKFSKKNSRKSQTGKDASFIDEAHKQALATLNLKPGCSISEIKKRRNELAKKFHPDIRGGDKQAEEILKNINQAYTHLLSCTPG